LYQEFGNTIWFKRKSTKIGAFSRVTEHGLEWNSIEKTIVRWIDTFAIYGLDTYVSSY